jgi:phosphoserine phosphatase
MVSPLQVGVDFFLERRDVWLQELRVACFDMDSCVLANECIDEMASEFGCGPEVAELTRRAMVEGLNFPTALRTRLALLKSMPSEALERVWQRLELNPGAARLFWGLARQSVCTAIVSGGFTYFAWPIAAALGASHAFANSLARDPATGALLGDVEGPVVDGSVKERVLLALAARNGVGIEACLAVGDGANDRLMVTRAGRGFAYRGKALLRQAAPHHLDFCPLDALLLLLPGYPRLVERAREEGLLPVPSPSLHQLLRASAASRSASFMALLELLPDLADTG